ncbi:hypothetical protein HYS54_03205, partial [Candidatus Micrarchaeota archaeon]|nr:hypothetical protein [Candidatus Micrarchaeota archaeon]
IKEVSPQVGTVNEETSITVTVSLSGALLAGQSYDVELVVIDSNNKATSIYKFTNQVQPADSEKRYAFATSRILKQKQFGGPHGWTPADEGSYTIAVGVDPNGFIDPNIANNADRLQNYKVTRATIKPACGAQVDQYGWIELKAAAGYYSAVNKQDKTLYCSGTKVTATVGGFTYELKRGIGLGCDFTRVVRLPLGNQLATFTADNTAQNLQPKSSSCTFSIARGDQPYLITYSPENLQRFAPDATIPVSAVLVLSGETLRDATLTAALEDSNGVAVSQTGMSVNALDIYSGSLKAPSAPGSYKVRIKAKYQSFSVEDSQNVTVSQPAQPGQNVESGLRITIQSPSESSYEGISDTPAMRVVVTDESGSLVQGATVTASVVEPGTEPAPERGGGNATPTVPVEFRETPFYYEGEYEYPETGDYQVAIVARKGALSASSTLSFTILPPPGTPGGTSDGLVIRLLSPDQIAYPNANAAPPVQVQVEDVSGTLVSKANLTGTVSRFDGNTTMLQPLTFSETPFYYQSSFRFATPGEHGFTINARKGTLSASATFSITIGNVTGGTVTQPGGQGLAVIIVSPQNTLYEAENVTPPVVIVVKDENNNILTGATLQGNVTLLGKNATRLSFRETPYYYTADNVVSGPGEYVLNVSSTKGTRSGSASISFAVGPQAEFRPSFLASIITPLPRVYPENAALAVRAKITLDNQPVTDASAIALLGTQEILMEYEQFGEYSSSLPPLPEGAYSLRVIAGLGNATTEDRVDFAVSKKRLFIDVITPNSSGEITQKSGEPVTLAFNVRNEHGDVESGVQVEATILDPSGRRSVAQAFQSTTGEYSTKFFATEQGTHHYNVTAEKIGFVTGSLDSQFIVTLDKKTFVFGWDAQTVLNVLLVIAILILIAAAFRAVF